MFLVQVSLRPTIFQSSIIGTGVLCYKSDFKVYRLLVAEDKIVNCKNLLVKWFFLVLLLKGFLTISICFRSQVIIGCAMVMCHRFYMRQSHAKNDWQVNK